MSIPKLRTSFARFTDSGLETKARQIMQDMTGNPNFPAPVPTLAELATAINAYSTALVNAANLGRLNISEKNQCRLELELLLTQLGNYVMFIANGDGTILDSSGFDRAKERESAVLTNPGAVTLGNGITTGEMTASVKAVKGAKGYLHQYTTDPLLPEGQWVSTPSSRSKITFAGLEAGRKYFVRVAVVGNGEQVAYSPVANMYVQ